MTDAAVSEELLAFIKQSPSPFHAVHTMRTMLDQAGFTYLPESEPWRVQRGGAYYTVRNNSSIVAFKVGASLPADAWHFQVCARRTQTPPGSR